MLLRRMILLVVGLVGLQNLAHADDWPQWFGPKHDGIWRESGLVDKFPAQGPKVVWRASVDEGYSGPAVAQGKVFVTDRVFVKGSKNPDNPFDKKTPVAGKERVLCFDQAKGTPLWSHEYDCAYQVSYSAGPRTTPIVSGKNVYTLGAMGDLLCLDIDKGEVIWSKQLLKEFNGSIQTWGFASSPLIDGDRLICLVGGSDGLVVTFDKNTGKKLWSALPGKEAGYAPPVIYNIDGTRQLIIWTPGKISSLNPESGEIYWSTGYGNRKFNKAGLSIPTPQLDGHNLFFTSFYEGPLMLKVNGTKAPEVLWQGKGRSEQPEDTDGIHSIMPTPFIRDGHIYGVCSYGELRCLKESTGERVWQTYAATTGKSVRWGNAFLTPIGEKGNRFILFNELGDLILADLTEKGYQEISRAHILAPTNTMAPPAGRLVVWTHPAFANRCVFARNDRELICVSLAQE